MDIELLVNGSAPSPHLGIFNGQIQEGINQVTRMELLAVSTEEYNESALEDFVSAPVTLKLSEVVNGSLQVSRFDGVIYEFHQMNSLLVEKDIFAYRLVVRPWIWQFHIGANSRSFPKMSRIEVIDAVLEGAKGIYYDTEYYNNSDYPPLWQILQTDISDWEFVCRLMREAGINFYFGAPKDGGSPEMMHLVDKSSFFPKAYNEVIPWNPSSGMVSGRHVNAFETQARIVPKSVEAIASFGDGMARRFAVTTPVSNGKGGTFRTFGVEGQEESAAATRSKFLSEGFGAHRITYHGESDHFVIRAGERVTIGGPYMSGEKKILITAVNHQFSRTVAAAIKDDQDIAYENTFLGIKPNVDIRPIDDLITIDTGTGSQRSLSLGGAENKESAAQFALLQETVQQLTTTVHQLAKTDRIFGLMLGEVVKDTRVTEGKEMTCLLENERFPDGITAKVSVAWLVPGGGVTCLPRKGMQVYFMLEQGAGGQNEAVVVGYRPSAVVPGRDPAASTETQRLKKGGGGSTVVEADKFSPVNRERVGVRGEKAVCEVTLLDKEGSVSVNADKDVYLNAGEAVHLRSDTHLHMAETVGEQYGTVERYVDRDQEEWINGDHEMKVSGNQTLTVEKDQRILVEKDVTAQIDGTEFKSVKKTRTVTVDKDHTRDVKGNEIITVKKERNLTVTKDNVENVKGVKRENVEKDRHLEVTGQETRHIKKAAAFTSDDIISLQADKKVVITCGSAKVTIEKNGDVTINGKKFTQKASGNMSLKGSKVTIN